MTDKPKVEKSESLTKRNRRFWGLFAALVLGGSVLVVFWDALFSANTLFSMDGCPFYGSLWVQDHGAMYTGSWMRSNCLGIGTSGGGAIRPARLLIHFLPLLTYHVWFLIFNVVFLAAAGIYLLRSRGVGWRAAWIAGIGLAFSGYFFTLVSAGHRNVFECAPWAVMMLGALDRAITRRSLFHFCLAGASAAFGMAPQPDIMGLFFLLAVAYSLFLFIREWRARVGRRFFVTMLLGGLIGATTFGLLSVASFNDLFKSVLPGRAKQMESYQSPEQKYQFATDWSMPPEEILEFVAPAVYGYENRHPEGPYWGRLGRTPGWEDNRQGLVNLRQHTLYMGVISLVFGGFAVALAIKRRRDPEVMMGPPFVSDVRFWFGAFLVSVLLALGRYTFIYRIFYSLPLPFIKSIRCPVKFIHVAEVSLFVMAGLGLNAFLTWLRDQQTEPRRNLLKVGGVVLAGLGVLLVLGAFIAPALKHALLPYWETLGMKERAGQLIEGMQVALLRGGALFFVGAGVMWLAAMKRRFERLSGVLAVVLLLVVAVDLVSIGRKYVHVRDVSPWYARNPVLEAIGYEKQEGRMVFRASQPTVFSWLYGNFRHHGVDFLMGRDGYELPPDVVELFEALNNNPLRLWQLTNTRYLVMSANSRMASVLEHPMLERVAGFNAVRGRVVQDQSESAQHIVARFDGALPKALLYYEAEEVSSGQLLQRMADPGWSPAKSVLTPVGLSGVHNGDMRPSPVRIVDYEPREVSIEVDAQEDGVLLLNDRYDPRWQVTVDGREQKLLRCNAVMRGVVVPKGHHTVVFSYHPYRVTFVINLIALLLFLGWFVSHLCLMKEPEGHANTASSGAGT